MSLKRRLIKLEDKTGIKEPKAVIYIIVIDEIVEGKPIIHYEKIKNSNKTILSESEFELDSKRENKEGNIIIVDDMVLGLERT